ncbi:MAG: HAMP domain-containing histidine kinase, partial [Bacteroidales bacterium]|nr:HAMP domain-containing histidine kinase [Bacteroidales bacterium]
QYYVYSMSFARYIKSVPEKMNTAESLAKFYEKNQLSDSAIVYYKLSNALKDTIKNKEFHQKITKSIASYEQKLQAMKTDRQRNIKYWLIVTIGMGFLIIIILLRQYRIKQKQNRQLKILNQKMMVSETQLRQLNHTKDKLFSIIAHDLKNPFIALLSISKALIKAKGMSFEEQTVYISKMYVSLKSLNELLENLLSWARSQLNKVEYYPEFIMPEAIVGQAIKNLDLLIDQKNITVKINFPDGIEIYADKTLFRIVVENLLSNALKFSQKDSTIEIYGTEKDHDMQIQVKDFGIGMGEETKKNLFKFKYLTSMSGTEGERGTGLGVHICKEFVEKNNGKIWVESEKGIGTIFTFTVPKLAKDVFN